MLKFFDPSPSTFLIASLFEPFSIHISTPAPYQQNMYHPRHHFSRRAPPCDHSRTHRHGPPHCDEYLDIIDMLHGFDLHNVAELEHILRGAHMGDRQCINFETELEIMEYNHSVLAHYHLLSPAWLDAHDPLMGLPMDGGRYGGGVYIPSGAPGHHHHDPGHNHHGAGHHHYEPRPSNGRDGRGVPYLEDTGSEASVFPGYRATQGRRGNQGRRGGRQPIDRDEEDRYETSPPPRRGGRRRRDEDEIEDSESDASAPPPRRAGGRTRRDPSPEVSERRERVGARNRRDEDEDSDSSPPLPPRRRAGGDANAEEQQARVEHTGQTNMHWQPGGLRFEDIQELESGDEEEEEEVKPAKSMKKGGKSGGGAKEGKGQPRDRY